MGEWKFCTLPPMEKLTYYRPPVTELTAGRAAMCVTALRRLHQRAVRGSAFFFSILSLRQAQETWVA